MISLCFGRQRRKERTEYTLLHYQSFAWSNASSLLLVGGTGGGGGKAVSYLPPTWYLSLGMELAKKKFGTECCQVPYLRRVYRSRPATMPPPPSPPQVYLVKFETLFLFNYNFVLRPQLRSSHPVSEEEKKKVSKVLAGLFLSRVARAREDLLPKTSLFARCSAM